MFHDAHYSFSKTNKNNKQKQTKKPKKKTQKNNIGDTLNKQKFKTTSSILPDRYQYLNSIAFETQTTDYPGYQTWTTKEYLQNFFCSIHLMS